MKWLDRTIVAVLIVGALLLAVPLTLNEKVAVAEPQQQSAPAEYKLGDNYTLIVENYERDFLPDGQCMRIVKNDNTALTLALSCQSSGKVTVQQNTSFTNQSHIAWIAKVSRPLGGKTCVILLPKIQEASVLISCY